jgi:hypothetical protein
LLGRNRLTGVGDTLLVTQIDPASIFIDRSKKKSYPVENILLNGHPTGKIDLVFISEGYTADRKDSFYADARRFSDILFQTPPFDSIGDKFNIRAVFVESEEAETDFSGKGIFKNTAFNSGFYTFGTDRYLTTEDIKSVRDAVWNVPCDAVFILVDSEVYGGGGIYNFYAIGTAHNERTAKVFVHEFGHSFAGLADEYFSSAVAYDEAFYNPSIEPWEPNITTLINFDAKWKSMLSNDTPVPTPPEEPYNAQPGVFEGGGYVAKGVYRPMNHCMMRDYHPFCPVCSKAILDMAKYLTDN